MRCFFLLILRWLFAFSLLGILIDVIGQIKDFKILTAGWHLGRDVVILCISFSVFGWFLTGYPPDKLFDVFWNDAKQISGDLMQLGKHAAGVIWEEGRDLVKPKIDNGENVKNETSEVSFSFNDVKEFSKIITLDVLNYSIITSKPLVVRAEIKVKNKSLWFVDVDSKEANTKGEIYCPEFSPNDETTKIVILREDEPLDVWFYNTRGRTEIKNLLNIFWIGSTGNPIPEADKVLESLIKKFGTGLLLKHLKENPDIILKALIDLKMIPEQTTLTQFLVLEDFFGKVSGAIGIVGVLMAAPNQARAIDEWLIINKEQKISINITIKKPSKK